MKKSPITENTSVESITIRPRGAYLFVPPIVWRGDPEGHIGENDTFFYLVRGEICLFIDEECFILREGDLAFLPKGKMRAYTSISESVTMYEIAFSAQINGKEWHEALSLSDSDCLVHPSDGADIRALFEGSVRYEVNKLSYHDLSFLANIAALISIYARLKEDEKKKTSRFAEVEDFMKDNLSRSVTLGELAEVAFSEPTYFIKKFKAAYGISPISYFNRMKIYKAMHLLSSTSQSVYDIAGAIGIHDGSYFTRLFKTVVGLTPSEYRAAFDK